MSDVCQRCGLVHDEHVASVGALCRAHAELEAVRRALTTATARAEKAEREVREIRALASEINRRAFEAVLVALNHITPCECRARLRAVPVEELARAAFEVDDYRPRDARDEYVKMAEAVRAVLAQALEAKEPT